jgi:hypothetical protein
MFCWPPGVDVTVFSEVSIIIVEFRTLATSHCLGKNECVTFSGKRKKGGNDNNKG